MKIRPTTIVLAAIILGMALPSEIRAAASLQVPVGPRAIAMGGAFSAIADDATATYWNPAGLPWVDHQEVVASHADRFGLGIRHDYASLALPITRTQTGAAEFSRLGFEDTELDFGDSRIGLSYGYRPAPYLAGGVSVRYLSRHTDLDGASVRQGNGLGVDFGVLFRPRENVRVGAVAQDVFDTRITYSRGEGTVVALPRTLRFGAAYSPLREGTIAMDIDDLVHLGAEYTPITPLTLRAGVQTDPSGAEETRLSFGAGLRWNTLRFDYALEDHPTLGATTHFGVSLGFNFNPPQLRIEKISANDLYSSLYKSYTSSPVGSLRMSNLQDDPITTQVRVLIPELMTEASEQEVVLRPHATLDVPITAVLPDRILARSGDRSVQLQVSASYQSRRLPRTEKASARLVAYAPGAIDWSRGLDQAAAFVTTRDPLVESVARDAVLHVGRAAGATGIRNLDFSAAVFDAVEALGVTYVPDPTNPYSTISGVAKAVDTIFYPRQTLERRTGDCDDTTVLLAALLGNVGIRTRLVGVPGHIFLLAATDLHERNRLALGLDERLFVVAEGEVWIPIETTALGKGFAGAWRDGAEAWSNWAGRGQTEVVDVARAQARFEAGDLPGASEISGPPGDGVAARLDSDLRTIGAWRAAYFAASYGAVADSLAASAGALNRLARVYRTAGRLEAAGEALARALGIDPGSARTRNNLGVLAAARGDLVGAQEHFLAATASAPADPGPWLNLGMTRYAAGDTGSAEVTIVRGVELSGGYPQACALLGIAPGGDDGSRGATTRMTAEEARQLLLGALRRVPRPAPGAVKPAGPRPASQPWRSRMAGTRSTDRADLSELLYWKP